MEDCGQVFANIYKINLGFGWVRWQDGKCKNTYTIVSDDGTILSNYEKIHPFFHEQGLMTVGDQISSFELEGYRFSMAICYDLRFPEINWPGRRSEQWMTLLRARAIENQMYLLEVIVDDINIFLLKLWNLKNAISDLWSNGKNLSRLL